MTAKSATVYKKSTELGQHFYSFPFLTGGEIAAVKKTDTPLSVVYFVVRGKQNTAAENEIILPAILTLYCKERRNTL